MDKKLTKIANKNETAKNVIDFISERKRNTVHTAFSGLRADMKKKYGKAPDREHFDQAFKDLASEGFGKLKCSKRGVCLGFTWVVPIREIARRAKNNELETVAVATAVEESVQPGLTRKPVTVILIRRNQAPQTIYMDEAAVAKLA